jgi:hypothetical protein
MKPENRLSNEEIKARLILIVGVALSFSFVAAEAWAVLSPMLMTLAGGLIGLLAGNGLKDKPKDPPSAP